MTQPAVTSPASMSPALAKFLLHDWPQSGHRFAIEALAAGNHLQLLDELVTRAPDLAFTSVRNGVAVRGATPEFSARYKAHAALWAAQPENVVTLRQESVTEMVRRITSELRAGSIDVASKAAPALLRRFLSALTESPILLEVADRDAAMTALKEQVDELRPAMRAGVLRRITRELSLEQRGDVAVRCGVATPDAINRMCAPNCPFDRDDRLKMLLAFDKPLALIQIRWLLHHGNFTPKELQPLMEGSKVSDHALLLIAADIPSTERCLVFLEALVAAGADLNGRPDNAQRGVGSPLEVVADHAFALDGAGSRMRWMLRHGADLRHALKACTPTARSKFQYEALACLVDAHAPGLVRHGLEVLAPFAPDASKSTLLQHAFLRGPGAPDQPETQRRMRAVLDLAIRHAPDVNQPFTNGTTALIVACRHSWLGPAVIDALVARGADVGQRGADGTSPLEASTLSPLAFATLLRHGANVDVPCRDDTGSVRDAVFARAKNWPDCAVLLQAHDALAAVPASPSKGKRLRA